jgi:hypothetical protein
MVQGAFCCRFCPERCLGYARAMVRRFAWEHRAASRADVAPGVSRYPGNRRLSAGAHPRRSRGTGSRLAPAFRTSRSGTGSAGARWPGVMLPPGPGLTSPAPSGWRSRAGRLGRHPSVLRMPHVHQGEGDVVGLFGRSLAGFSWRAGSAGRPRKVSTSRCGRSSATGLSSPEHGGYWSRPAGRVGSGRPNGPACRPGDARASAPARRLPDRVVLDDLRSRPGRSGSRQHKQLWNLFTDCRRAG